MKKSFIIPLFAFLFSSSAWAGGYQLFEYSVTNLGRSFGGAGIVGDDYSAIAFNPAGMTLKQNGIQVGGNLVAIRAIGEGQLLNPSTGTSVSGSPKQGEIRTIALLPHLFAQKQLNERIAVGMGIYVPFGLGTYYKKGWFGASHALDSEINAIDIATALSIKLTDTLSVGANIFAEYVDARLTNTTGTTESDLNADGWKPGYTVGLMYQPFKDTRFGIAYRSKVSHKIKGTHYFHIARTEGDCGTTLNFPEHILISAYQKIDRFGLSAIARWTRWDRFDTLTIHSNAYQQATGQFNLPSVDEKWRNVWMAGIGVDYYHNSNWTFRTGLTFDQGAVRDASHRTARVPDSNRWIASAGGSYLKGPWQFDLAYAHMFIKTAHSYNQNSGSILEAKYSMGINLLGASVQYHF